MLASVAIVSCQGGPPGHTPPGDGESEGTKYLGIEFVTQLGGRASAVAVEKGYAYLAKGLRLITFDVSDPDDPLEVGSTGPLAGHVFDLSATGGKAYLAAGRAGLVVVDVADPGRPNQVGSFPTEGQAVGVVVDGGMAYVAGTTPGGGGRLSIVKVDDVRQPRLISAVRFEEDLNAVDVSSETAFVVASGVGEAGLVTVDVSDATNPRRLGELSLEFGFARARGKPLPLGLRIAGTNAYVAAASGLAIADVADPFSPRLIGTTGNQRVGWRLALAEDVAYVVGSEPDLVVVDVSSAANPAVTTVHGGPNQVADVAVNGDHIYLADASPRGLSVLDVASKEGAPRPSSQLVVQGYTTAMAVSGRYLHVAYSNGSLVTLDVSDPLVPREVSVFRAGSSARAVAASGDLVHFATVEHNQQGGGGSISVIDASDPSGANRIGYLHLDCLPTGIAPLQSRLVLACTSTDGDDSLRLVDLSDPARPVEVGRDRLSSSCEDLSSFGSQIALAASYDGVWVLDYGAAPDPRWLSRLPLPDVTHVTFDRELVYSLDRDGKLTATDISDPGSPRRIGQPLALTGDGMGDMVAASGYAVVALGDTVTLIDSSDRSRLQVVTELELSGEAAALTMSGDTVYLSSPEAGIIILRLVPAD